MRSLGKIKQFWQRFKRAQKGTTVVIFGIVAVPLLAIAGGAVDYGRAVKTKAQLITTLDAAVLAAMMQYSLDEDTDYKQVIKNYVLKNLEEANKSYHGIEIDVNVPDITEEGEMKAGISTTVKTNFLMLVGFDQFDIHINSASMVGGNALEVALVLDNTGSMAGDKIADLKDAAKDLVDVIMPDGANDNIKMSLIPFADYVNIGMDNRDESGLDIPLDITVTSNTGGYEKCWNEYPNSTQECTTNPYVPGTCYNDGVPYDCMEYDGQTCTGDKGDPVEECKWVEAGQKDDNYKWCGVVGSRKHDLNVKDEEYSTGVPGIMSTSSSWCNAITPVTRLTSNRDSILAGLDAMKSERNTYIPSGLVWGWRSISGQAPFADGVPDGDESVKKVIVLMTDGSNTKSMNKRTGESASKNLSEVWDHSKSNTAQANTYTSELCANIKEKNIMVFTIAFDVEEGSDTETLMQGCAGNGGKYFDADDGEALGEAFKEIGLSLLNLRLSQ